MKKIIFTFLAISVLFNMFSCNNSGNSAGSATDYQQNKMSLEDQEKNAPLQFLTTDGTYHGSLFGSKQTINGTITNKATIATFKDVNLLVHFYSKTNTEISSAQYVIYDFFPPNQSKTFSMKIAVPDGTSTLGWDVVSATPQ